MPGRTRDQVATLSVAVLAFALAACDSPGQSGSSAGSAGQSGTSGEAGEAGQTENPMLPHPTLTASGIYTALLPGETFGGSGGTGGQAASGAGGTSGNSGSAGGGGTPALVCIPNVPAGAPPSVANCGDGWLSPGEQCDDGNILNGDGCSSTCVVTPMLVAPHDAPSALLPGRELGSGSHPTAVGCNTVGVSFVDHASTPAALKLSLFSSVGVAQGVSDVGTSSSTSPSPSLAALPDDTFVAAWTDFDSDELGVQLRKITPGAGSQASAIFANQAQDFSQRDADVIFDGGQRIVVAWVDDSDPVNGPDLRYRTFSTALVPTSDDVTLAATGAVEDHVTLAAFHGQWAAAWRSGTAGSERIEVQSGSTHWTVGPFLPGGTEDRPALAFIDPNHLAMAYTEGTDPLGSGVANVPRLHAAVLDTNYPGQAESFEVTPTIEPYASAAWLSQTQPSLTVYSDRLALAWRLSSVPGDPQGDELWSRELKWSAGAANSVLVDTSAAEKLLLSGGDVRAGDQARPVLLSSSNWPDHRLMTAWEEDSHRALDNSSSLPDVLVQFSQVPGELPTPAPGPCTVSTFNVSPPGPAVGSTSVTLTATGACGGSADAEYEFAYQSPDFATWNLIRGYDSNPSATWNTTGLPSGQYGVFAYVRRKGTTGVYESYNEIPYLVGNVCSTSPTMTISPTGVQPLGTVFSISANATCTGSGTVAEHHTGYYLPGTSKFYWIGDWSTGASTWDTTGLPSGSYTIQTLLRGYGNKTATWESYVYGGVLLGNVCYAVNSFNPSPASPQGIGATINLSATASCVGSTVPEFLYYFYAPGSGTPVQVGTWSSGPVAWDTTGLPPGYYTFVVLTRGAGNNGYEASGYGTFQLGNLCPSVSETAAPTGQQPTGTIVTVSATAGCSSAEYAFNYRLWGQTAWNLYRDWSATPTASWNTAGLPSGTYELRVDARIGGHAASETQTEIGYLVGSTCAAAAISASPVSPHAVGTTVTLSASSTCTSGATPEYQFYYRVPGSPSLVMLRDWGPATYDWETAAIPAGPYSIYAYARAQGNTDTYDSAGEGSYVLQ